jgi:CRISPR system Cascade subunit CasA
VAPWQITDHHKEDPFTAFASVRPDFDGALAQFLIGLLQTASDDPERSHDWRQRFDSPPSPENLRDAFQPLAFAFELFGDGPRFLQDLTLEENDPGEERIERLLIGAPGENTLSQGRDHFIKGGRIEAACPACAAMALLSLQINAPSGGQGHRTGIRGGGPLTTLVVHPESLWKTLWLNVLLPPGLDDDSEGRNRPEDRFPWLAPTRTSGKEAGLQTTLADVHPLQLYWAMPRRIRLLPDDRAAEPEGASCSLCGSSARPLVRAFLNRNLGVNYTGAWNHPLTPYRKTDAEYLPLHGSPAGLSYRNWLGFVQNDPDRQIRPAVTVAAFTGDKSRRDRADYKLWAFGYDMDNMKARAWLDGRMPLHLVPAEHREDFELDAQRLISSAAEAAGALVFAAKRALTDRPKDMAHDPADLGVRFWQETEAPFYEHLRRIRRQLEAKEETVVVRRHWLSVLWSTANAAFHTVTVVGSFAATDPKRVALAWNGLQGFFRSVKLQRLLGLPLKRTRKKNAGTPAEPGDAR